MKRRRGMSLAELLVVLSVGSVILTMSASLIHRAMHVATQARAFQNIERNSMRLSNVFRRDIHAAGGALVSDNAREGDAFLRLALMDGRTLAYSVQNGVVSRTLYDGDKIASREAFTFSANSKLEILESKSPRSLTLSITADPMVIATSSSQPVWNQYSTRVSFQAEASVGRDLRFTRDAPSAKEQE